MLDAACAGDVITPAFQPIVDLARSTTVGFEALARFAGFDERRPDRWFAAARALNRHAELEATALRAALSARAELPANCFLTVNVSPDLLPAEPIRDVWRGEGDLTGLVIELTEHAPIESYESLEDDLFRLRKAGALIAVDDAGAGYAGMSHLLALRPSIIKLDRELIQDIDIDEARHTLVEMVGTFAGRVDAWLLAEGVERDGELDALAALGVPLAQGYHLARPGPAWPELNPEAVARLAARTSVRSAHTVRELLEAVPTAPDTAGAMAILAVGTASAVVVIDHLRRPFAVYAASHRQPDSGVRGMCVNADTPLREVLLRAVTRDARQRYEPIIVTDSAGRYVGIVRMERMIHAIVALSDS